jgi:hypothetical protein
MFDMYHTVLCTDIFKASMKEELACKISGSLSSFAEGLVLRNIKAVTIGK